MNENRLKPAATGLRNRFSRTDKFGIIDSPTRSAQTRLIPRAIASRGDETAHMASVEQDASPCHRRDPEQRPPDALLPRAPQPDQADDLARVDLAFDGSDLLHHDRLQGEPRRTMAVGRTAEDLRWLAPHDQKDRFVRRRLRNLSFPRDAPVAQHDHAIGDLEHLVETVRDVDHRDAASAQPTQRREQPRHLVGRQARGRLVKDKNLGLGRERAGDRHQRLFGAAQILDARVGIDVGAERVQRNRRAAARRVLIDHAEAARKAERHADVFGHRHPVDQAEVLMDEGDRQAAQGVGDVDAAKADAARVERIDAGQNLDQRRLARAVLAQERKNLAGLEGHADVRQRFRAAEALEDAAHLQQLARVSRLRPPVR